MPSADDRETGRRTVAQLEQIGDGERERIGEQQQRADGWQVVRPADKRRAVEIRLRLESQRTRVATAPRRCPDRQRRFVFDFESATRDGDSGGTREHFRVEQCVQRGDHVAERARVVCAREHDDEVGARSGQGFEDLSCALADRFDWDGVLAERRGVGRHDESGFDSRGAAL